MTRKSFILIMLSYIFLILLTSYYIYEYVSYLIAVSNYEAGSKIVYLYNSKENLLFFRLIQNVMPLGTSVEVKFITFVKAVLYICQSFGIIEFIFLFLIAFLVFYNYFIEENQKDIVYIYNALMRLFSAFIIQVLIYLVLFLLSVIFLKILYETTFIIISIVLIIALVIHVFTLIKSLCNFYKFLKFR